MASAKKIAIFLANYYSYEKKDYLIFAMGGILILSPASRVLYPGQSTSHA